MTALKDTPALIIDLRGNGGGLGAMAEALVGPEDRDWPCRNAHRQPVTVAFGAIKLITLERDVPGRADAYAGKVAVLMDSDSASASEATAGARKAPVAPSSPARRPAAACSSTWLRRVAGRWRAYPTAKSASLRSKVNGSKARAWCRTSPSSARWRICAPARPHRWKRRKTALLATAK